MNHKHIAYHKHDSQYVILFLILATGFFAISNFVGIPGKQLQVAIVTAFAYVIWGIFHHYYLEDLHVKIVVEYVAIALTGFALLYLLLNSLY